MPLQRILGKDVGCVQFYSIFTRSLLKPNSLSSTIHKCLLSKSWHEVALQSLSGLLNCSESSIFQEPMIELQGYNGLQTGTGPR